MEDCHSDIFTSEVPDSVKSLIILTFLDVFKFKTLYFMNASKTTGCQYRNGNARAGIYVQQLIGNANHILSNMIDLLF